MGEVSKIVVPPPNCGVACADYIEETLLNTVSRNTVQGSNPMMILGKTLGGGMVPMSAVIMKRPIAESVESGGTSSTLHGYPWLGSAIALKVLETVIENDLPARNMEMGEYLLRRCLELQQRHPWIGDVRGRGLMVGLEFVSDPKTKEPLRNEVKDIAWRAARSGLIVEWFGLKGNVIKLYPNYFVTKAQLDEGLDILDRAITDVERGLRSPTDFSPSYIVSAGYV